MTSELDKSLEVMNKCDEFAYFLPDQVILDGHFKIAEIEAILSLLKAGWTEENGFSTGKEPQDIDWKQKRAQ